LSPLQDAADWLPKLDVGRFLAGEEGALEHLAEELRHACQTVGFYFLVNYEAVLPDSLVSDMLLVARDAHGLPKDVKEQWVLNDSDSGYMPVGATTRWGSSGRPTLPIHEGVNNAVLFWGNGPPWVPKDKQLSCLAENNFLPDKLLPRFREVVTAYKDAVQKLARALLPAYALALQQKQDFFNDKFVKPCWALRLNHYPPTNGSEIGVPPHADGSFCTFLLQDDQPGCSVLRSSDNQWVLAPAPGKSSMLVNTGNSVMRLSNGLFPSTMHSASCLSTGDNARARISVPFFWSPSVDVIIEPLSAFVTPERPAQFSAKESGNVPASGRVGTQSHGIVDADTIDRRSDTFIRHSDAKAQANL